MLQCVYNKVAQFVEMIRCGTMLGSVCSDVCVVISALQGACVLRAEAIKRDNNVRWLCEDEVE